MRDISSMTPNALKDCLPPNLWKGATIALNVSYVDVGRIESIFRGKEDIDMEISIGDILGAFKEGMMVISCGRLWILLCRNPLDEYRSCLQEEYTVERCIDLRHITSCSSIETILEITVLDGNGEETLYLTDLEPRQDGFNGVMSETHAHSIARMIEDCIPVPT